MAGVTGSGPTKVEQRTLESFSRVEVGNGIGLTVHIAEGQTVEVDAQQNILPLVTTKVESGVLKISSAQSFTTSTGVTVTATVPALDGISASGGSQAQIDGFDGDRLDVELSGGAGVAATGSATEVTVGSSGGARADLARLAVKTMKVNLSGGATAALNVSDRVTGSASGGAVATVAGGAALDVQVSGGSRVTSR
jgi:hypothetical protein